MEIVPVPESAKSANPGHVLVNMGPPPGVSDEQCGTAQMLLGTEPTMPQFGGRDQLAFFKPTPEELEALNAGAYVMMNQLGRVVQPFSVGVWPGEDPVMERYCLSCKTGWSAPVVCCPECGSGQVGNRPKHPGPSTP